MARIIIVDDDKKEEKGKNRFKELSSQINAFYKSGKGMDMPGLTRFDEPKTKRIPLLKRKWY